MNHAEAESFDYMDPDSEPPDDRHDDQTPVRLSEALVVVPPPGVDLMEPQHPLERPRCAAHSKQSGQPCKNWPLPGASVCRIHGGAAPQVKRSAQLRLLELIDPAIARLAHEMDKATRSADRQRAANSILDRAGVVRSTTPDADLARALLIDRLRVFKITGQ
jgi:hypothetical protein